MKSEKQNGFAVGIDVEVAFSYTIYATASITRGIECNASTNTQNINNNNSMKLSEFECPVCYEEFSHLLCHMCRPKFTLYPTCCVSLSSNIRNRILEQILSTKQSNSNNNKNNNKNINKNKNKNIKSNQFECKLCNKMHVTLNERNEHYNICENRLIQCTFIDCKWIDEYSKFCIHAENGHHASNQSKQQTNISINNNNNNNETNNI